MIGTKNSEIIEKVENSLKEIRPFLEADDGDIILSEITEDLVVKLEFLGACKLCSISNSTKTVIEYV